MRLFSKKAAAPDEALEALRGEYQNYRRRTAAQLERAEADGMKAYNCPSCGAELICDASTAATSCPYCGNPTVVPGQFSGAEAGLRPALQAQQGGRRGCPEEPL